MCVTSTDQELSKLDHLPGQASQSEYGTLPVTQASEEMP